jgi:tRNA (guanine-N7-)-methyltransferase
MDIKRGQPSRIKSYVRREGRFTPGQRRALAMLWDRYGVDFQPRLMDPAALFGRRAPLTLDIGSGMGHSTVAIAAAHPDNDYLAVETHRPGVGSLLRLAAADGVANLRVIHHDVVEVLEHMLADGALDQVFIFFPDPWPKKRHHKRRLINDEFLVLLWRRLKPGGRVHIATDWEDYAQQIVREFDAAGRYLNLAGQGRRAPRPRWRPPTKFEQRGRQEARAVHDFLYAKASSGSPGNSRKS